MGTAAIILAGGRGHRLGGAAKPLLRTASGTLLDQAVAAASTVAPTSSIIVVGPAGLPLPVGTLTVQEHPAFSGPVAAIGAGLGGLQHISGEPFPTWVWVLAADQPTIGRSVALLTAAIEENTDPDPTDESDAFPHDGVIGTDDSGRQQPLAACYSGALLTANVLIARDDGDSRVRRLVEGLDLLHVPLGGRLDVDDPDDAAHFGIEL